MARSPGSPARSLPLLAGASLVLLLLGVGTGAALGGVFPSPFVDPATAEAFFAEQPAAVLATAVLGFLSALPLLGYAAGASAQLRRHPETGAGAAVALGAGGIAVAMLAGSGLIQWVLTRPSVRTEPGIVHALHDLAFLTGGVGHVVFLGLMVGGFAAAGLGSGLLPRALAVAGLVIAAIGVLASVSLVWSDAAVLLPICRFPGLLWLIAAGVVLAGRSRAVASARARAQLS